MKMSRRNLALLVLVAMLAAAATVLLLWTEETEAGPVSVITVTENWRCYNGAFLCDSDTRTYVETDESFWHWINPWLHPHITAYGTRTVPLTDRLSNCSGCKRPW